MEEGLIYKNKTLHKLHLADYFHQSVDKGFACAVYRLPQQKEIHMIIDCSGGESLDKVDIENLSSGFVFHPFSRGQHQVKFLNRDIHLIQTSKERHLKIAHSKLSDDELMDKFYVKDVQGQIRKADPKSVNFEEITKESAKNKFINLTNASIDEIEKDTFQKVVISRTKKVKLSDQFDPFELFEALTATYKNVFVNLTYIPGIGTWAGATPETLININKENQFQTVALAATQAYNKEIDLADTTWSQKDIEEQAMVSRYIINCFKKIRLREFEEIGPRTYLSGNLVHLKTNYLVDMNEVNFPDLGSVMLELLHPTSAVCGMPKDITKKFIEDKEGFDREYFSGYLGPVNMMEETNIFVNLRCTKIESDHAQLFAGAGIIANSNPEKEWRETEIKMDTILSVLQSL